MMVITSELITEMVEKYGMSYKKTERLISNYANDNTMTLRKLNNRLKKEAKVEQEERQQRRVKRILVNIEWKKSSTWGNSPHARASIEFVDGSTLQTKTYTATGCGYDKESTIFSNILNDYLKYKLWELENKDNSKKPYGIKLKDFIYPSFAGGVGMSCYLDCDYGGEKVLQYLGGSCKHIQSTNKKDIYEISFN